MHVLLTFSRKSHSSSHPKLAISRYDIDDILLMLRHTTITRSLISCL